MRKKELAGPRRTMERSGAVFGTAAASTAKLTDVAQADQVRAPTRERVLAAANKLGYLAHGAARALASQRTRTIGAIFPPVENPVFATGTHALSQTLSKSGYTLLLATHDYSVDEELLAARHLMERGVDGLVLVGLQHDSALLPLLDKVGMPYELTWSADAAEQYFSVGIDHTDASAAMTRYLLALGHRQFAVIAGQVERNDRAAARLLGVRATLAAAGVALADHQIVQSPFSLTAGRQATAQLLDSAGPFTAIIAGNDLLAVGAVLECQSRGIAVPEQITVVGFDDIELAGQMSPGITTIRVPSADIGRLAGQRLLERLAGQPVPRCEQLQFELIERDTAAAPPTGRRAAARRA